MKAKGRKEKAIEDLKITAMYMYVVIMADAMADAFLWLHEISAPESM